MSDPSKIDPRLLSSASGTTPARRPAAAATPGSNPAFEVLLERLTSRAAELEQRSHSVQTPQQVGEAVDAARASLEDALTLGERLLEAYRQARQTGSGAEQPFLPQDPASK